MLPYSVQDKARQRILFHSSVHRVPEFGWKTDFVDKNTPVLPYSGGLGPFLLKKSDNLPWRKGGCFRGHHGVTFGHLLCCAQQGAQGAFPACVRAGAPSFSRESLLIGRDELFVDTTEFHMDTLYDVLDVVCMLPSRFLGALVRMPIPGILLTLRAQLRARRMRGARRRDARCAWSKGWLEEGFIDKNTPVPPRFWVDGACLLKKSDYLPCSLVAVLFVFGV